MLEDQNDTLIADGCSWRSLILPFVTGPRHLKKEAAASACVDKTEHRSAIFTPRRTREKSNAFRADQPFD
jgi:hypothetical protein